MCCDGHGRKREKLEGQEDGGCAEAGWGWWGMLGGLEPGCGAVISPAQKRTCLCLRDAALSQAKDSIHVVKRITGTLFPVSAFGEARICTWLSCLLAIFQVCNQHP